MQSTMQDYPLTVSSLLRYGSSCYGDSVITTAGGSAARDVSYACISDRAARLANALRGLGITADERVATFAWNNQEHFECYAAVPSMGAVLHPLNIRLHADQIVYIANHAEDRVVIVDASLLDLFAPLLPRLTTVHTVLVTGPAPDTDIDTGGKVVLSYEAVLSAASASFTWPRLDELSGAVMCYTSGTTGNPKGVVYSHRSVWLHSLAVCSQNALGIGASDRILVVVPMFHANAWGMPYAALMSGASLIMPDRLVDAESLVRLIETCKATVSGAVPTIWNDVLQYVRAHPGHDLSSLRMAMCGGSAVPRQLMQDFENEVGPSIVQVWGMTETSPLAAIARPPAGAEHDEQWRYRTMAGRLICGVEGRIVDDEGTPLASQPGVVGELQVRGPWVTGAYYKVPSKHRAAPTDGWLPTGDVGSLDERGFLTLSDRTKDIIKSGGEWISSVDLETTLMAHPDVIEAAVIGVPDERWQERPLAVLVRRPGCEIQPGELRGWLAERVPRWWVPERWAYIDAVPRTSVGKFDKKELRKRYADGQLLVLDAVANSPGSSSQLRGQ